MSKLKNYLIKIGKFNPTLRPHIQSILSHINSWEAYPEEFLQEVINKPKYTLKETSDFSKVIYHYKLGEVGELRGGDLALRGLISFESEEEHDELMKLAWKYGVPVADRRIR